MKTARMLPTDRKLTPSEIEQVARDFDRFLKERRVAAATVSKSLGKGFSASVISTFRNCVYKGDQEHIARAVNEWMERMSRADDTARPEGFVETEVAKRILTIVRTAVNTNTIAAIYGPAGVGKTMTFEACAKIYTGSVPVRITQGARRATGLVNLLSRRLGVPHRSSLVVTLELLIDALKGSNRPIFIDEAHKLHHQALEVVRDLHDAAGVPIALWGTIDLNRNVTDTEQFYGQFNRRISGRCDIMQMANRPQNPKPLFTVDEIIQVFGSGKVRLSKDGADFLQMVACIPGLGGLGFCEKLVMIAGLMRNLNGKPIDAKTLRSVARTMHGHEFMKIVSAKAEQLNLKIA